MFYPAGRLNMQDANRSPDTKTMSQNPTSMKNLRLELFFDFSFLVFSIYQALHKRALEAPFLECHCPAGRSGEVSGPIHPYTEPASLGSRIR